MNAPLPNAVRGALEAASLEDKYSAPSGRVFMSGVQALVRLPMLQQVHDQLAGHHTAGFISGYRGSPLGNYDQALWAAKAHLQQHDIVFQPGVNEELAATAVWGTQQLEFEPAAKKFDGVFGLWYGKGPGVDRSADVFKHANLAGTAPLGGVVAVAGDDHTAKSSTAAHQSDHLFKACGLPVFFPASVQEILDLGLHAFAMSRFAGLWTAMKTIQEVVESATPVNVSPERVQILLPEDFPMPAGGLHIRWPDERLAQEERLLNHKLYAALAYVRANRLNHNVIATPHDRFGLIASGKAYNDTRQALVDLGLDDNTCRTLGIRVHKVAVVWPLEASSTREFAQGLREILVVEEKRQVIEYQLKEELYNWRADVRPDVLGKFDDIEGDHSGGEWAQPNPSGNTLLRATADLSPALIAKAIARRLKKLGVPPEIATRMDQRIAEIEAKDAAMRASEPAAERVPWFCSGCPHNTSTRVPEGSRATAGIGCHYMVTWMDRETYGFSQMGGEGVSWVGQAPFSKRPHLFANLGDGTYYHSGLLAIRQAIAAKVPITYKLLYNDAVAMTGGQRVEGHLSVSQISRELVAEGVTRLVVVTDEPEKYQGLPTGELPPGTAVHHRDELDTVQRLLREVAGVTVLIYDQTCATEKRRRRKRGTLVEPERRVFINEAVCEGCGDCSEQSHCLSVEPVETAFGRKRRINQHSCNKDYSCLKGFCPSFVTVEGGSLRKPAPSARIDPHTLPPLPEPTLPAAEQAWGIVVAGVGGTGVITIGQVLGMAAFLEGKGVVTQDAAGLAQKGGATWSHVQIATQQQALYTTKVDTAKADLVIACDDIVAAKPETLRVLALGRSYVALNRHATPTAAFVHKPDWQHPGAACEAALRRAVGAEHLGAFDAEEVASQLLGDAIYANPLMLGYAWQQGRIPLGLSALRRAIELNGVQVANNLAAFEWGRRCAHELAAVQRLYQRGQVIELVRKPSLEALLEQRMAHLRGYQNAAYAARYRAAVERVREREAALIASSTRLTEAVARQLAKLMAYKDEYEVARLHSDPAFAQQLQAQFEGPVKLVHHLAPPLLARKNAQGEALKQAYGPWVHQALRGLARLKVLRGTPFDPFGYTAERRTERALVTEYLGLIDELLQNLSPERLSLAVELAQLPEQIRGYGHVKARHLSDVRARWARLLAQWRTPSGQQRVA